MDYLKKTVILKGDANATFTMQRSIGTKYSLTWQGEAKKGDILIFDEKSFYRISGMSGMLPCDISCIYAVAVGDELSVRGQLKPFNWSKARSMLASASRKSANEQTKIKPTPTPKASLPPKQESSKQNILLDDTLEDNSNSLAVSSSSQVTPSDNFKNIANEDFNCPICSGKEIKNPFPKQYPNGKWIIHEYPSAKGKWHYLTAELYDNNNATIATALALPGSSGVKPAGDGFNNYCLSINGRGYWIRTTRV